MKTPAGSVIMWVTSAGTTLPRSMPEVSQSFWSTMQRELLDRQHWSTRIELASAIFEWIEGWYNPRRPHSSLGNLSPHEFEALHTAVITAA